MISKEEYEILKGLEDKWKWIARDETQQTYAYKYRPIKSKLRGQWESNRNDYYLLPHDWLQCIQWEDGEPYSIAELMGEYESEETEVKKDIEFSEELQESIMRAFDVEATSKTIEALTGMTLEQVAEEAINGGIVPKRELPVIPNHVAEWISEHHEKLDLYPALRRLEEGSTRDYDAYKWYRRNTHTFVNAYLTRKYEVEGEQKYYVVLEENSYGAMGLGIDSEGSLTFTATHDKWSLPKLTEREIKDYDERYWPFAVKVEEWEND